MEEQEALLKKETLAEQQKYDHDANQIPQLVRLNSIQELVTLEDMVLQQHEEEVQKLESIVTQQSLRQNARLEERLLGVAGKRTRSWGWREGGRSRRRRLRGANRCLQNRNWWS